MAEIFRTVILKGKEAEEALREARERMEEKERKYSGFSGEGVIVSKSGKYVRGFTEED
jgi:hypothetical protein